MNIGIIADSIDTQYAGIHFYTAHLLNALAQIDSAHRFFIVKHSAVDRGIPFDQKIIPPTIKQMRLDPVRTFITIPRYYNSIGVDAVIEPAHFGPFGLKKHIKRITVIHDLTPILLPQFHPWYSSVIQKISLSKILANAHLILANSDNTKNDIASIFPSVAHKVARIYLGRDETIAFTEDKKPLAKYGIKEPYILFVGTLEPRKNLLELLRAYHHIRTNGLTVKLVLVGKNGWHNAQFNQALAGHAFKNDIICTGYAPRTDLSALYSHAKVFVYPSLYEGFGFPVAEALACKTPVVISNISSLPEVGGSVAYTYRLGNAQMLAHKITDAIENGKQTHLQMERYYAQSQKFSWTAYARQLLQSIEQL